MTAILIIAAILAAAAAAVILLRRRQPKRFSFHMPEVTHELVVEVPPQFNVAMEVPDDDDPEIVYTVNPHRQTCTCARFADPLRLAPLGSPDRFCSHLIRVLRERGCLMHSPLAAALGNTMPEARFLWGAKDILFAFAPGHKMLDVYTHQRQTDPKAPPAWWRYGYDMEAMRWRRLQSPPNRNEVMRLVKQHFA